MALSMMSSGSDSVAPPAAAAAAGAGGGGETAYITAVLRVSNFARSSLW